MFHNNTVLHILKQERKLFKFLKKTLNKKDKSTIIVSNLSLIDAFELGAKRLGKEVMRPHNNCIIIDNKILITTAPIKSDYIVIDVSKENSERGKRCQEFCWT